jgi:hypothetical protein
MKYCDLLVLDAVYSKPFYSNDREIVSYLTTKLCCHARCTDEDDAGDIGDNGDSLLSEETFKQWLQHKKCLSRDAKTREKLLTKKYRALMQSCVENWAALYYHPNIAISLDSSRDKYIWLQKNDSLLARLWKNNETLQNERVIFGIAEEPRQELTIYLSTF